MLLRLSLLLTLLLSCLSCVQADEAKPLNRTDSGLSFSVLKTASSSGTLEAMVVAGGSYLRWRELVQVAMLVRHPKGDFLWDSGIGTEIEAQMSVFSFLDKQLFSIKDVLPVRTQFDQHGYDSGNLFAIIPSHMHWDHVSGIEDFLGTPVWVQDASLEEAKASVPPGFVSSQFDDPGIQWQSLTLEDGPYMGFEQSKDIYGDQSAVLVDLSGHAHGQVGLFLNLDNGERYFFIGDTTWVLEGITNNQSRSNIVQWLVGVDADIEQNAALIDKIHHLSRENKDLVIVPAHDEVVLQRLPIYPLFSKVLVTSP